MDNDTYNSMMLKALSPSGTNTDDWFDPKIIDPQSLQRIQGPANMARDFWQSQAKPYTDTYRYLRGQMPPSEEPSYFGEAALEGLSTLLPVGKLATVAGLGVGAIGKKALGEAAETMLPRIQNPIRAYHGSPHDFDTFDLSKIGTGEGAQAYGHGLYFAEHPETAATYKQATKFAGSDEELAALNEMRRKAGQPLLGRGRMYEVGIHADPSHLLDWDKPLAEQPYVTQKMPDVLEWAKKEAYDRALGATHQSRADELWNMVKNPSQAPGEFAYRGRADRFGNDPRRTELSEILNQSGVPGIRYLDQGSRDKAFRVDLGTQTGPYASNHFATRADAEQYAASKAAEGFHTSINDNGTRNYVVFDPRIVEIMRKYGWLGPVAGASQMLPQQSQ